LAGIYLHIPFCKQACHYCNFHFTTSLHYKNDFIKALLKEIEIRSNYPGNDVIETIYFGGGTPSLCTIDEIKAIFLKINSFYKISSNAEITLEANPDDITEELLAAWKETGINRLSIGIQSFFDEDLAWMNRAHTAQQALENLQLAKKYFENITIDLIYGTPQMTIDKWEQNIKTALALDIPHLSCYALTVEPKTTLEKLIKLKKTENINPDNQSEQFSFLMHWLGKSGFEHYEISNFAKPGWRSRHNSAYWQGEKYIGFGPSAHSYDKKNRQWNISNNNIYIESLQKGILPFEIEELTDTQKLNEYIMTSIRTSEGLMLNNIIGTSASQLLVLSKKYINSGLMKFENNSLILTNEGKLLADGIAADLFF